MSQEESIWAKLVDFITIIDSKISKIEVDIKAIRKDLNYHIKRTNQNEQGLETLTIHIRDIENKAIVPLQRELWKFKVLGGFILTIGIGLSGLIGWLINIMLKLT